MFDDYKTVQKNIQLVTAAEKIITLVDESNIKEQRIVQKNLLIFIF